MHQSILYCGDTDLTNAACYLAGLMTAWGWEYEYVPSHVPLTRTQVDAPRTLYVFSDYPAAQANADLQRRIVDQVRQGAGLLMIGGWESFHGCGGNWDGTPIGDALPVTIANTDDRRNFDQPTFLRPAGQEAAAHPILAGLPWNERPPLIGGLNQLAQRADAAPLLSALSYAATFSAAADPALELRAAFPALVVGACGRGRTGAFATDIAPHWVGGFVDWGPDRVAAQAPGAPAIEVGSDYARFWRQLLAWTANAAER